jgi:hypothetical protein
LNQGVGRKLLYKPEDESIAPYAISYRGGRTYHGGREVYPAELRLADYDQRTGRVSLEVKESDGTKRTVKIGYCELSNSAREAGWG